MDSLGAAPSYASYGSPALSLAIKHLRFAPSDDSLSRTINSDFNAPMQPRLIAHDKILSICKTKACIYRGR